MKQRSKNRARVRIVDIQECSDFLLVQFTKKVGIRTFFCEAKITIHQTNDFEFGRYDSYQENDYRNEFVPCEPNELSEAQILAIVQDADFQKSAKVLQVTKRSNTNVLLGKWHRYTRKSCNGKKSALYLVCVGLYSTLQRKSRLHKRLPKLKMQSFWRAESLSRKKANKVKRMRGVDTENQNVYKNGFTLWTVPFGCDTCEAQPLQTIRVPRLYKKFVLSDC